jgi:hypothetical protein
MLFMTNTYNLPRTASLGPAYFCEGLLLFISEVDDTLLFVR